MQLRVDAIHSVNGETHTAPLALESFAYAHEYREPKPWMQGLRSGGLKEDGSLERTLTLARLCPNFAAMTLASHLLCLAIRRDMFAKQEFKALEPLGWQVVHCCAA